MDLKRKALNQHAESLWLIGVRIVWVRQRGVEDQRRKEQQDSRSQKDATEDEEREKSEGMNPLQADRFDAQPHDQQNSGEPKGHGSFHRPGAHSWGPHIFTLSIAAALWIVSWQPLETHDSWFDLI